MWRGVHASQYYQDQSCVWEEHTKTIGTDGLPVTTITEYEGIFVTFAHMGNILKRGPQGYYNVESAEAIVPYMDLENVNLVPSTHSSHIARAGQKWRVVGINDYSQYMQNHCYFLKLERVELNDN